MILRDKYDREYSPMFSYGEDWEIGISPVNKHSFSIMNKKTGIRLSRSSKSSFEEAEEKAYEMYKKTIECHHDWERWLPHANTGICKNCTFMKNEMFEPLKTCEKENCKNGGEFTVGGMENRQLLCVDHYIEYKITKKEKLKEKVFTHDSEGMDNKTFAFVNVLEAEILKLILDYSQTFKTLDRKAKKEIVEDINWSQGTFTNNFIIGLSDNDSVKMGVLWNFEYSLPLDELFVLARYWFNPDNHTEEENLTVIKEVYEALKKDDLLNLDLSMWKAKLKEMEKDFEQKRNP